MKNIYETGNELITATLAVCKKIDGRLQDLLASASHPLVRSHLVNSQKMLDYIRFTAVGFLETAGRQAATQNVDFLHKTLNALNDDYADWEFFERKGLPIAQAFTSAYDFNLCMYGVILPYKYDPNKRYPLVFFLHGATNHVPAKALFDCYRRNALYDMEDLDPEKLPPQNQCIVVFPWCRGNSMYQHAGEADFWEVYHKVHQDYSVDTSKRILAGHSMGCHGTNLIGGRTPHLWSALMPCGSANQHDWVLNEAPWFAENLNGTPLSISWEDGPNLEYMPILEKRLQDAGCPIHRYRPEGKGHYMGADNWAGQLAWCLQFERQQWQEWWFTADTHWHPGCNGVYMQKDTRHTGVAHMHCRVRDGSLIVDTRETDGLHILLGEDVPGYGEGLHLQGETKVVWNGKEVYRGPAQEIFLGTHKGDIARTPVFAIPLPYGRRK